MRGKLNIVLILSLSVLFLLGAGSKNVELLDSDKQLIDLDKAIEYAKPGGAWASDEASNETEEESADDSNTVETQNDLNTEKEAIEQTITVVISVRGKVITYKGSMISGVDELKDNIATEGLSLTKFSLVDAYADSKVYKECMKLLEDSGAQYELN